MTRFDLGAGQQAVRDVIREVSRHGGPVELVLDGELVGQLVPTVPPEANFDDSAVVAALHAADESLQRECAGCVVAYVDDWHGPSLTRRVVAKGANVFEFNTAIQSLPVEIRARMHVAVLPRQEIALGRYLTRSRAVSGSAGTSL